MGRIDSREVGNGWRVVMLSDENKISTAEMEE
jgi:hypothetical protein